MTFWRTFHLINEDLAFVFGFVLNILLLVITKKVKVKSLQKYNTLLFQCCCVDMLQVIISIIVKPIIIVQQKNLYYLCNGFLRSTGWPIEAVGICLWTTSVFFCINSMPVSYIFRYRTVVLNAKIHKGFYIISLVTAFFSASTFGALLWTFNSSGNVEIPYSTQKSLSWLIGDDKGKISVASFYPAVSFTQLSVKKYKTLLLLLFFNFHFQGTLGIWLIIIDSFAITFIPYTIMIICNIKVLDHLRSHRYCLSRASRRVQGELNRILTAQAIIPVFTAFLPMSLHIFSAVTEFDLFFASFICGILYSWIPTSNALSIFFFISAYRRKSKKFFRCLKSRLSSVTFTSTITIDD